MKLLDTRYSHHFSRTRGFAARHFLQWVRPTLHVRRHFKSFAVLARQKRVCLGVCERFGRGVEGEFFARSQRDVAQVAESCAQMAGLDVGVGRLPAPDALDKVADVPRLAVGAGRALGLVSFLDAPAFLADNQRPLFAVKSDAEELPLCAVVRPDPVLVCERGPREFLGHGLCIDRKSTRLNSSHRSLSRMPSSA